MTTLAGLAQVVVTMLVFWGPGWAVIRAAGYRGRLRTAAVAPATTLAVFFAGSFVAVRVHVRWSLWLALGCTAAVVVMAHLARRRWFGTTHMMRWRTLRQALRAEVVLAAVVALAFVAQLTVVWKPLLRREQVANLTDILFHFNALQYVRVAGIADPVRFGSLIDPQGGTAFYPSGWHAVAGVVPVLLDNTSLLAAASFAVIAGAWTCGLAALAQEVAVTRRRAVTVLAAALGAFGAATPLEPVLSLGIIPDGVALALVPGTVAVVVGAVREHGAGSRSPAGPVLATILVGLGACHPSALAGAFVVALPWVWTAVRTWWMHTSRRVRVAGAAGALVAVAGIVVAFATSTVLAIVRSHRSESAVRLVDAMVGLVLGSTAQAVTIGVVVPAFAFLAWVLRFRQRQDVRPIVSWSLAGVVYVLAAMNVPWGAPLTGFFYMEARRVVPLLSIWAVVLGAEGVARAVGWVVDRTYLPVGVSPAPLAGVVSGLLVVLASWQPPAALAGTSAEVYGNVVAQPVTLGEIVPFFTSDEMAMVNRLPAELPAGSVLFGAPKSGVGDVFGLTGVASIPFAMEMPTDLVHATASIDRIGSDPLVCEALRKHGITHLYTDTTLWKGRGWPAPEDPFATVPTSALRLVDEGGSAKVYAIVGCGR